MDSIYNLQDLPTLETKTDPIEYRKFYDQTSGFSATSAGGPVKTHFSFRISDINSFWLLSRAYLLFEFNLTNVGHGTERQTVEYLGKHFDRVLLRLGDTLVEDKTKYVYRDSEVDALSWGKQYAETVGSMALYKPESFDTSDKRATNLSKALYYKVATAGSADFATLLERLEDSPDAFDVPGTFENHNHTATRGSKTFAMLPLVHLFNFLKVYDKVMRGLDIEIELYMAPDSVRIIRSNKLSTGAASVAGDNAVFNWSGPGITLMVPRVVPTPKIQAMLNMQLAKGLNVTVPFEKSHVYRLTIPDGAQTGEWNITTATSTPTRIYLMIRAANSETDQRLRLFARDRLLTRVDVFVNGEKTPTENLTADGATGSGILERNFMTYLRQWHDMQGNIGSPYQGETGHSNLDALGFFANNVVAIDLKQKISDLPDRSSDINVSYQLDLATTVGNTHYLYAVVFSKAVAELQLSEARSVALIR